MSYPFHSAAAVKPFTAVRRVNSAFTFIKARKSLLLATACFFLLPSLSFAEVRRGTVYLENQTGKRVTYQFKWGKDAPWKDYVLQPGTNVTHRKVYDPKGVPAPYIRVAAANGFEGPLYKPYKLNIGWNDHPRRYHFSMKNDMVDLFRD